jgi:hypothetical protein
MSNKKTTSDSVASAASKVLTNSNSSKTAKQLAGSALSQVNKGNETSKKMETLAGKILDNPKSNLTDKKLAGSVLSQSDK